VGNGVFNVRSNVCRKDKEEVSVCSTVLQLHEEGEQLYLSRSDLLHNQI